MSIKRVACVLAVAAGLAWLAAAICLAVVLAKNEPSPVPNFTAVLAGTLSITAAVVWSTAWIVERQHAAVRVIRPAWLPAPRVAYAGPAPAYAAAVEPGGGPTVETRPPGGDGPFWKAYEAVTDTVFGPRDDDPEPPSLTT